MSTTYLVTKVSRILVLYVFLVERFILVEAVVHVTGQVRLRRVKILWPVALARVHRHRRVGDPYPVRHPALIFVVGLTGRSGVIRVAPKTNGDAARTGQEFPYCRLCRWG